MNDVVEKVKAVKEKRPDTNFDWDQFQKADHRRILDVARREFLSRGPREMLVTDKRTKQKVRVKVTGAITRIDGTGSNQTRTLCRFFRPGMGAQTKWTPGCVPRPDLMNKGE